MGFNDEFDAVNRRTSSPGKVIGSPGAGLGRGIKRLKTNKKRLSIFLRYYSQSGNYGMSCRRAGVHVRIPKQLAKASPTFRRRMEAVKEIAFSRLEQCAIDRACDSSDVLLMFLMKSLKPEIYGLKSSSTQVNTQVNIDLSEELRLSRVHLEKLSTKSEPTVDSDHRTPGTPTPARSDDL